MRSPVRRPVYTALHRPPMIGASTRSMVLLAVVIAPVAVVVSGSFVVGLVIGGVIYGVGMIAGQDPQVIPILWAASQRGPRYDPLKRDRFEIEVDA